MSYNSDNYEKQGGAELVIGGELNIASGGTITAAGTQASTIADLKVDYTTGDLDNEAKTITAFNTTNAAINSIIAALKGAGIIASSQVI